MNGRAFSGKGWPDEDSQWACRLIALLNYSFDETPCEGRECLAGTLAETAEVISSKRTAVASGNGAPQGLGLITALEIVEALNHAARSLGVEIIAEGIETEEEARACLPPGCHLGQGFLFGRLQPLAFHHSPTLLLARP